MFGDNDGGMMKSECRPDPVKEIERADKRLAYLSDSKELIIKLNNINLYLDIPSDTREALYIMVGAIEFDISRTEKRKAELIESIDKE